MKLTRRGTIYLLLSVAFLLIAAVNAAKPIYILATVMLSLASASWLYGRLSIRGLEITRCRPGEGLFAANETPVYARIRNRTGRTIPRLIMRDRLPCYSGAQEAFLLIENLAPYEEMDLEYDIMLARRGSYRDDRLFIEAVDPLGIVSVRLSAQPAGRVMVYPQIVQSAAPIPDARYSRRIGDLLSTLAPEGRETFSGVRDYHCGDDLRRIHWRATARTGRLFVKEFEREAIPTAIILLDARCRDSGGRTVSADLEDAVTLAASLMSRLLQHRVRLLLEINGADDSVARLPLGRQHFYDIMARLATLSAGKGRDVATLIDELVQGSEPGSNLYIITADPDPAIADRLIAARAARFFPSLLRFDAASYKRRRHGRWQREYTRKHLEQTSRLENAGATLVDIGNGDNMADILAEASRASSAGIRHVTAR